MEAQTLPTLRKLLEKPVFERTLGNSVNSHLLYSKGQIAVHLSGLGNDIIPPLAKSLNSGSSTAWMRGCHDAYCSQFDFDGILSSTTIKRRGPNLKPRAKYQAVLRRTGQQWRHWVNLEVLLQI